MESLSPQLLRKLRELKLVATDLDGTLLDNRGQISVSTRESVRKLKSLGLRVAIMTARAHSSAERIADELGIEMPIISLDGGVVRLPHGAGSVYASRIKPTLVRKVLAEVDAGFSSAALFTDDKMVRREHLDVLPGYIDSLELDSVEEDDLYRFSERAVRVIVSADSGTVVKSIARRAGGLFSGVEARIFRSSRDDARWYLEIRNRRDSKATGLARLEKYLGIRRDEVAVLGDFQNDMEAFDRAGVGVAMKNAVRELKDRADWITSRTNDEDGASEFMELVYSTRTNAGR